MGVRHISALWPLGYGQTTKLFDTINLSLPCTYNEHKIFRFKFPYFKYFDRLTLT